MTPSGLSAAATCITFKTPPAASTIPQILFFWIYKIQSPSLYFEILQGMCAQNKMANAQKSGVNIFSQIFFKISFQYFTSEPSSKKIQGLTYFTISRKVRLQLVANHFYSETTIKNSRISFSRLIRQSCKVPRVRF